MRETMRRTDNVCYWCRNPAISARAIEPGNFLGRESGFLKWLEGDVLRRERMATIDHLIPIGGNTDPRMNDPRNLVVACANCNKDRHSRKAPIPRACIYSPHCYRCGSPKPAGRKTCDDCHVPLADPDGHLTFNLGDIFTTPDQIYSRHQQQRIAA